MKLIAQGAEAKLYKDNDELLKIRISKSYRVKELDFELRKRRTRREAKVLEKLTKLELPVPELISSDDKTMEIRMGFIDGKRLSEHLSKANFKPVCKQIGKILANLHAIDIIHGDLTTSNLLLKGNTVYLIDFGLSFNSKKIEDKAVDLHVLKEALESKHHEIMKPAFEAILSAYKQDFDQADM